MNPLAYNWKLRLAAVFVMALGFPLAYAAVAYALDYVGSGGNDTINGSSSGDYIWGCAGSDTLNGDGGNDHIYGDGCGTSPNGADDIRGGTGGDALFGNAGEDTLRGEKGEDQLDGGAGDDWLSDVDQNTNSILKGGEGFDVCHGDQNNVTFAHDTFYSCEAVVYHGFRG